MTGTHLRRKVEWTDAAKQKLKELWPYMAAEDIALQFRGATRNSIIGKAHRLGLPSKKKISKNPDKKPRARRKNPMVVKVQPKPKPVPVKPEPPRGNLIPFTKMKWNTCRSVEEYGPDEDGRVLALYCSNPKTAVDSFCEYHKKIYYRQDVR